MCVSALFISDAPHDEEESIMTDAPWKIIIDVIDISADVLAIHDIIHLSEP